MHIAYLLMGGNMGNREENLTQAAGLLSSTAGKLLRTSSFYETAPWGNSNQPGFLNQAAELETSLSAAALMEELLAIESKMGRERMIKYGPRIIDLDILLYDNEIHATPHITIPHPELQNRRFALEPLAELIPDKIHPILELTIGQLLLACKDPLTVNKLTA